MKQKSVFERYLEAAQYTMDASLRLYYQKAMIKQALWEKQEREQLVKDIANEVLSNISATVDASEIFDKIDGLNEKIESLGR